MPIVPTLPDWVGKPPAPVINEVVEPTRKTIAGANSPVPIIYGRDRVFGKVVAVHVDEADQGMMVVVYAFCQGEVEEVEQVFVDGVAVTDTEGVA